MTRETQAQIDEHARVAVAGMDSTARESLAYALLSPKKMRTRWLKQSGNATFGPALIEIRRRENAEMARSESAQHMKKLREAADDVKLLRISVEEAAEDHGVDAEDLYRVVHGMRPKTKSEREEMEESPKTKAEVAAKKEAKAEPKKQGKRVFVDAGRFTDWEEVDDIPSDLCGNYKKRSPWHDLLNSFIESGKKCIRKKFADTEEAKKAVTNLQRMSRQYKLPVKAYLRGERVYLQLVEKEEAK